MPKERDKKLSKKDSKKIQRLKVRKIQPEEFEKTTVVEKNKNVEEKHEFIDDEFADFVRPIISTETRTPILSRIETLTGGETDFDNTRVRQFSTPEKKDEEIKYKKIGDDYSKIESDARKTSLGEGMTIYTPTVLRTEMQRFEEPRREFDQEFRAGSEVRELAEKSRGESRHYVMDVKGKLEDKKTGSPLDKQQDEKKYEIW